MLGGAKFQPPAKCTCACTCDFLPNETHPKVQPRAGRENQEGVTGSLTNEYQRRRGDLPPATDSLPGVVPVKGLSPAKTQLSAADSYESALENVVRENAVPSLAGIST